MYRIKRQAARAALFALAGVWMVGAVHAQTSGQALAEAKACLACHQIDSKRVGPPFRGVAERYAGQSEAAAYLAGKIRGGSRGAWGAVPMPAQSQLSADEAQRLAQWVLSLAPAKP